MSIIKGQGLDRTDIETPFREVSFSHADAERLSSQTPVVRILPEVNVLKIGGQSIMDRGRAAVYPLLEEIVSLRERHKLLLGVGGGTRARHAYAIALDLGMPTTVLAKLGRAVPYQNARMLQMLRRRSGCSRRDAAGGGSPARARPRPPAPATRRAPAPTRRAPARARAAGRRRRGRGRARTAAGCRRCRSRTARRGTDTRGRRGGCRRTSAGPARR